MVRGFGVAVVLLGLAAGCGAQAVLGVDAHNPATKFKDPSVLKPPAGAKVAILEWEDLECPFCARAFPSVHAAAKKYNVPVVERDYLIRSHVWSAAAAVDARYVHDHISPEAGTEYRRELFASQFRINSREDLDRFTAGFFKANGKQAPAAMDADGKLQREINEDVALGDKAGLVHTPTIIVAGPEHWTEVLDLDQLNKAIEDEQARAGQKPAAVAAHAAPAHHVVAAKK